MNAKSILPILALGTSANIFAIEPQSCLETAMMTQLEMNQCGEAGYNEADTELNTIYKKIKEIYREDQVFLEKLKKAQLAWIKLRDADLDLQYPHADEPQYYGSVFPMCAAGYKAQLTLQRTEFLKQWLIGVEEGDVCGGSQMPQWRLKEILKNEYK